MKILNQFVGRSLTMAITILILSSPCVADAANGRILLGTDAGIYPEVEVFDGRTQAELSSLFPYASSEQGGSRVAIGDVNDDGISDIIVGTGAGIAHVKVFSGKDGSTLHSFLPYGDSFLGGVYVATGDVNGDGFSDIVTGAGAGVGGHVKVFDGRTGSELHSFFAFSPNFTGGVRVAAGDIDGDGRADIITGSGAGGAHVKVFSGKNHEEIQSFLPYDAGFSGGVFVAAGDVDGDRLADIITGVDAGAGPHVKVFKGSGAELRSFFAFPPAFGGGVRVAAGDVDGDRLADIIVSTGPGSGTVKIFSGKTGNEVRELAPFGPSYSGGVFVASGDLTGDGLPDVVTGADAGSSPHIKTFDGRTGAQLNSFDPFPTSFTGGVRVAMGDVNGDGALDLITGSGPGTSGPAHVKVFSGTDGSLLHSFSPYGDNFSGGVFVGSGDINGDGLDDIITGAGAGVDGHVKVFDGLTVAELDSFFAFSPTFGGGVRVAAGDVDGDGRADIITGSGFGGVFVKVFSGKNRAEIRSFTPYDASFRGGVFVAAGDVNGDGLADIITGADAGSGAHVKVFDGRSEGKELHSFFPFPAGFAGGVRVAAADLDGDGRHEILVASGPGMAPTVRVFDGLTVKETGAFLAYGGSVTNGVFIAAGSLQRPILESRFDPGARELIFRWPSGCSCQLEVNRDLADSRGWQTAESRPVQIGNRLEATLPLTLHQGFFRLNCPE